VLLSEAELEADGVSAVDVSVPPDWYVDTPVLSLGAVDSEISEAGIAVLVGLDETSVCALDG
jgi:copper chaperone CopZ